jgi:hypothetical protein
MKDTSKATQASRDRTGYKPTSISLSPEERALLDRLAQDRFGGGKGAQKTAVMAGLAMLDRGEPSDADLLAILARRLAVKGD